jgi:exopolysaccharide production protein ExoZ
VAAILVTAFHGELQVFRLSADPSAPSSIGFAAAGTDMLFVISGFVMVYIAHGKKIRFSDFFLRRIVRIVPLYWVFTLAMLATFLTMPALFHSTKLDTAHVLASFALVPYQHPVLGIVRPLLVPGWAINSFMFFYLVFGLFLFLSTTARIAAVAAALCTLVLARALYPGLNPLLDFYGAPIGLEFVLGMLVGWAYVSHLRIGRSGILLILAASAFVFGLGLLHNTGEDSQRVVYWGFGDAGLLLAFLSIEGLWGWPNLPILNYLGDASYAVYVTGLFSLALVGKLAQAAHLWPLLGPMGTRILLIASALAIGYVVHIALEQPLQRLTTALLIRPRTASRSALSPSKRHALPTASETLR